MTPVRRSILKNSVAVLPGLNFAPQPDQWHSDEVTTRTDIARHAGLTRVWRPVQSVNSRYQQSQESSFSSSGAGKLMQDGQDGQDGQGGAKLLDVEFSADCASASLPGRKSRFFHGPDGRKCCRPA